jgi:hypothetical protein
VISLKNGDAKKSLFGQKMWCIYFYNFRFGQRINEINFRKIAKIDNKILPEPMIELNNQREVLSDIENKLREHLNT